MIGIVLILLSGVFNEWCGGLDVLDPKKALGVINMQGLTASFFLLYFLCATQDIAVDGWALTILREENVGYQSMCNAAGQTLGYALAYVGALSLNHFQVMGFDQFMYLSGVAFLVTTVLVALFKAEKPVAKDEKCDGLVEVPRGTRCKLRVFFFFNKASGKFLQDEKSNRLLSNPRKSHILRTNRSTSS